jgi:hypothetical protein
MFKKSETPEDALKNIKNSVEKILRLESPKVMLNNKIRVSLNELLYKPVDKRDIKKWQAEVSRVEQFIHEQKQNSIHDEHSEAFGLDRGEWKTKTQRAPHLCPNSKPVCFELDWNPLTLLFTGYSLKWKNDWFKYDRSKNKYVHSDKMSTREIQTEKAPDGTTRLTVHFRKTLTSAEIKKYNSPKDYIEYDEKYEIEPLLVPAKLMPMPVHLKGVEIPESLQQQIKEKQKQRQKQGLKSSDVDVDYLEGALDTTDFSCVFPKIPSDIVDKYAKLKDEQRAGLINGTTIKTSTSKRSWTYDDNGHHCFVLHESPPLRICSQYSSGF